MITVTGYINRVVYTAVIDAEHTPDADHPGSAGIVSGSDNVLNLLRQHEGELVHVTPTGPTLPLDLSDPTAIVAGLRDLTQVVNTTGDNVPEYDTSQDADLPADVVF